MIVSKPENDILNKEILKVDFFEDFISFLKYTRKNTIKSTAGGNISLADLSSLGKILKYEEIKRAFREHKKFGWKVYTETIIQFIHIIRILAETMNLIYKRKNRFLLSKNGKEYLENISPLTQYERMVLVYWQKINWSYFSPGRMLSAENDFAELLQENRQTLWQIFLVNGEEWIDFDGFCKTLMHCFRLEKFYSRGEYGKQDLIIDVQYGLFYRNLEPFCCTEVEKEVGKYKLEKIKRFKPTKLGVSMFAKDLQLNNFPFLIPGMNTAEA